METTTLFAALFALSLSFLVVWTNPRRLPNIAFALILLILTTWLACVHRTITIGALFDSHSKSSQLEWWFRANAIVISFLPSAVWLLEQSILHSHETSAIIFKRCIPIFLLCLASAIFCLMPDFLHLGKDGLLYRGFPYYVFATIGISLYASCILSTIGEMRRQVGIKKVELQFLALNTGGFALILLGLNALGNFFQLRMFNRISIPMVLVAPTVTAWALLFHRVFNAKEMFYKLVRPLWFITLICGGIFIFWRVTRHIIAEPFGLLLSIAIISPMAVWLDKKSQRLLGICDEEQLNEMRRSILDISQQEPSIDNIRQHYKHFLASRFNANIVYFLRRIDQTYSDGSLKLSSDEEYFRHLCDEGWATPEGLERRRQSPQLYRLQLFLLHNAIGVLVTVPFGSREPSAIIALGTRDEQQPYTFPEIKRLRSLAELMDATLSRSQASAQLALRARMEYLALMSRGLAHDLKNLATPISTYLSQSHRNHVSDAELSDLHDAAKKSMLSVNSYINEILLFSKRLKPNITPTNVDSICKDVTALALPRAARRRVGIVVQCDGSLTILADRTLIERMLLNIVFNAIDASSADQVVVLNVTSNPSTTRFDIRDNGCGIPTQNKTRIFDPYFTTKNLEGEPHGLGIGLAIANEIALLHNGTINIRSSIGQETVVSVEIPSNPLVSPNS